MVILSSPSSTWALKLRIASFSAWSIATVENYSTCCGKWREWNRPKPSFISCKHSSPSLTCILRRFFIAIWNLKTSSLIVKGISDWQTMGFRRWWLKIWRIVFAEAQSTWLPKCCSSTFSYTKKGPRLLNRLLLSRSTALWTPVWSAALLFQRPKRALQ